MTQLETLYKRTTTGAIQEWRVRHSAGMVIADSGQLGGKLITNTKLVTAKNVGKANETSTEEQARLEAESDWRRKKDGGYKDLDQLGIYIENTGTYCRIDGQERSFTLGEALDLMLPQFNTDASGNVKPMLAHTVKPDFSNVKFPCLVQPKLDGVRALLIVDNNNLVRFISRSGKSYNTFDHIAGDVAQALLDNKVFKPFILDGEIYSDELTFQEITQAVKKQYPNSLKLKFRVYDIISDKDQVKRHTDAFQLVVDIASEHITHVETRPVQRASEIKELHDSWVKEGYEGAMVRLFDGKYQQGQRSHSLLKYKAFDEQEFLFRGWAFGERPEDLLVLYEANGPRKAKMQGSRAVKEGLLRTYPIDKDYSNSEIEVTIKFFGWTDSGLPRFPIGKTIRDY